MIGLGLGLTLSAARAQIFDPASLFAGTAGAWFDPSDLETLFQDAAGSLPVTTAGQTAGLALDKSQALAPGPELIMNGDFSSSIGWSLSAGATISGGLLNVNQVGAATVATQTVPLVPGATYEFEITCASITSGAFFFGTYTGTNVTWVNVAAAGTYRGVGLAGASNTGLRIISASTGFFGTIDNISVRELPGYHGSIGSGSFEPAYQIAPKRLAFDGGDDRLNVPLNPTASGSLAVRFNGSTNSRVMFGSSGASTGRCFIGLSADGSLGAGIGSQTAATIKGTADVRNVWKTGVVTWDGTTVKLYQDGAEVYSGAQSGAVNTTVPFRLGCLNNNGTDASFWSGSIGAAIALGRAMTPAEIVALHNQWSSIA